MEDFVLKQWHVVTAIGITLVSLFKSDVSIMIKAYITRYEQRSLLGKTIHIHGNSGNWEIYTMDAYILPIPFIRAGGVVVSHQNEAGETIRETFSYASWACQRVRVKMTSGNRERRLSDH